MRNTRNILLGIYAIGALVWLMIGLKVFGFSGFFVLVFALLVMFLFIPASPKKYWSIFHSSAFTITIIAFVVLGARIIAGEDLWDSSMGWLTGKKTQTALKLDKDFNVQYIWAGDPFFLSDNKREEVRAKKSLPVRPTGEKEKLRGMRVREVVVGTGNPPSFTTDVRALVEPAYLHEEPTRDSTLTLGGRRQIDTVHITSTKYARDITNFLPAGKYEIKFQPEEASKGAALQILLPNGTAELRSIDENGVVEVKGGEKGYAVGSPIISIARIYA
jgi:hypothetical protein